MGLLRDIVSLNTFIVIKLAIAIFEEATKFVFLDDYGVRMFMFIYDRNSSSHTRPGSREA